MTDETEIAAGEGASSPAPKRRWWRRILVGVGVLAAVLIVALATLPFWLPLVFPPSRVIALIERTAREDFRIELSIGALEYAILSGFELRELRIEPPLGFTEPPLRVDRIALAYDLGALWGGELLIEQLTIERPRVVQEARSGRTNFDVLFPAASSTTAAPAAAPDEPETDKGPLLPIKVMLKELRVIDAGARLIEPERVVDLHGLSLSLAASVGAERLAARLALDSSADARLAVNGPGLALDAPFVLSSTTTVGGRSDHGLVLEQLRSDFALTVRPHSPPLPRGTLALQLAVDFDGNVLKFAPRLELDALRLLGGEVRVDGLHAALRGPLAELGRSLESSIGLAPGSGPGTLVATLGSDAIDLSKFAPYWRPFFPDLALAGTFQLESSSQSGSLDFAGRPPEGTIAAKLAGLSLAWPSRQIDVPQLDGSVTLSSTPGRAGSRLELRGQLDSPRIRVAELRLGKTELALGADVLGPWPPERTSSATLSVALDAVRTPGAAIDAVRVAVHLHGDDWLGADRVGPPIRAELVGSAAGVRTEAPRLELAKARVALRFDLDRLLEPARRPIVLRTALDLERFAFPELGLTVAALALNSHGRFDDPRARTEIAVALENTLSLRALSHPAASLARGELRASLSAEGLPLGPGLPAAAAASLTLDLPNLALNGFGARPHETRISAQLEATARPRAGELTLRTFSLGLEDWLKLEVSGRGRQIASDDPWLELRLALRPFSVATLIDRAPRAYTESVPGLAGTGTISASASFVGHPLRYLEWIRHPERPPFELRAAFDLDDVSVSVPSGVAKLEGLEGRLRLDLVPGRMGASAALKIGELRAQADREFGLVDAALEFRTGRLEDHWSARGSLTAKALSLDWARDPGSRGLAVDLALSYAPFGDLELSHLWVDAPALGLELALEGRLRRIAYGAIRPEFALDLRADLARLAEVLARPEPMSGGLHLAAKSEPRGPEGLFLTGELGLEAVSYRAPQLVVDHATGRIPFEQWIYLPTPSGLVRQVQGVFGDDLELRLAALAGDLRDRSYFYMDSTNVLIDAPRTADYEALRPYRGAREAKLTIDALELGADKFSAISMDALYRSGVLRLDRFALSFWDGDVFGDMALQLTKESEVRFRLRGMMTDLNMAYHLAQVEAERYRAATPSGPLPPEIAGRRAESHAVTGVVDLKFDVEKANASGYFELTKIRPRTLLGLLEAYDVGAAAQIGLNIALRWFLGPLLGEQLRGATVLIRQNLVTINLNWDRPWFTYNPAVPFIRILQKTAGFITSRLTEKKFSLSLTDLVPNMRRIPLTGLWEADFWRPLAEQLGGTRGRLTSQHREADDE